MNKPSWGQISLVIGWTINVLIIMNLEIKLLLLLNFKKYKNLFRENIKIIKVEIKWIDVYKHYLLFGVSYINRYQNLSIISIHHLNQKHIY